MRRKILDQCFIDGRFSHNALSSRADLVNDLIKETSFLQPSSNDSGRVTASQRAWHVVNAIDSPVVCSGGNPVQFISFSAGYREKCSNRSSCICWSNVRKETSERMLAGGALAAQRGRTKSDYLVAASKIAESRVKNQSVFGTMLYNHEQREELEEWIKSTATQSNPPTIEEVRGRFPWISSDSTVRWFFTKNSTPLKHTPTSRVQERMKQFLLSHSIEVVENSRKIIPPLELDFYIPEYHLAIEINGLWTHSEIQGGKDKNYHLNKTKRCREKGITLLHFSDDEVNQKFDIVRSMILSRTHGSEITRIGARECSVATSIEKSTVREFLDENHIQGSTAFSFSRVLMKDGRIVAAATFGHPRFSKQYDIELLRFAVAKNHSISGGFSRILSTVGNASVVSYANMNYSSGDVYRKNGWAESPNVHVNYWYIPPTFNKKESRVKFQKHKLSSMLDNFDPALTEWENMRANGYDRIWDSGTMTFFKSI